MRNPISTSFTNSLYVRTVNRTRFAARVRGDLIQQSIYGADVARSGVGAATG